MITTNKKLSVRIDALYKIEDIRRLSMSLITLVPLIGDDCDLETMKKVNKIMLDRYVTPVVQFKCPDVMKAIESKEKQQEMAMEELRIRREMLDCMGAITEYVVEMSQKYENKEKPIDECIYGLIRNMAKVILAMNGFLGNYNERMYNRHDRRESEKKND